MKIIIVLCLASVSVVTAYPRLPENSSAEASSYKNGSPLRRDGLVGFVLPWQPVSSRGLLDPQIQIVGGKDATPHAFPHQVSLQIKNGNSWSHFCGGSIVAKDKVLTAAHCIYGLSAGNIRVVAGDHDLTVSEGTEQISAISKMVYHPSYNSKTVDFDFAVIRLSTPLTLNANVATINLPTATYVPSGDCINTGWGNTRGDGGVTNPAKLQQVSLPTVKRDVCKQQYKDTNELTERMLCAGAAGRGPCTNDSGGPLVCNGVLAGLVSWGVLPCAQSQYPGVFANVAVGLTWFASN